MDRKIKFKVGNKEVSYYWYLMHVKDEWFLEDHEEYRRLVGIEIELLEAFARVLVIAEKHNFTVEEGTFSYLEKLFNYSEKELNERHLPWGKTHGEMMCI